MLPKQLVILMAGLSLATPAMTVGAELVGNKAASPSKSSSPSPSKLASKAPQPDLRFLEYLGALEDDEENWTQIDLQQIAEGNAPVPEGKASAKQEAVAKRAPERK